MKATALTAAPKGRKKIAQGKAPAIAGAAALVHGLQNISSPEGAKGSGVVALGKIVQPRRGKSSPADHPNLPYIGLEHVEAHTTRLLGSVPAAEMRSTANSFQPGDVLYSRLRPYLNKVWRADRQGLCSSEFIVMPGNERVDSAYLCYRLNSHDFVSFANDLNAGDRPRVDFDQIASFQIWLPKKLTEQRRIVAEIEKQFTRLEAGVAALRRVQANLKRYRAAVLKAACEGKLAPTEAELCRSQPATKNSQPAYEPASTLLERILIERRKNWSGRGQYKEPVRPSGYEPEEPPEGWTWASLDQVLQNITDGDHQPPPKTQTGVPLLVIGDVSSGKLDFTDTRFVSREYTDSLDDSRRPRTGDLLYTLVGSYGICLPVDAEREFVVQRHIAILRPHTKSPSKFLAYILNSPRVFRQATVFATGTAQKTVPLAGLRRIAIPLPPLAEQKRIVAEVERRLSVVEELESVVSANLQRAARLRQSILQKAFSGNI